SDILSSKVSLGLTGCNGKVMVQLKVNFRSMVNRMDISEVVKISGLPPSTLRYYEQIKLIRSVGRNGLRRQYSSEVLNKLNIICLGRLAGFYGVDF
ncbi:MerR family DNA-binding transcriptional regulator, partial [Vibrio cincinnatiensis]|uniref:MerR family DNA-binding transcriptional regulator n=1 Tax=Vibrio cincinnatiensis TaxID=675 RepID=UPI001EDF5D94